MINIEDVDTLEVGDVNLGDYPDFSDAFFYYGELDGRELTEDELIQLGEDYPEVLNEMAYESLM